MANVLVEETSLENIASAIRSKNGQTTKYKPSEMADAISAISGGGITPTGTTTINITQNGTVTEDVTDYANAQVNVNVPSVSPTGTKQVSITQNGTTTEDVTNYASAEISVNVPNSYSASDEGKVVSNGALVAQTSQNITANGTYDTTLNDEVVVNVSGGGGRTATFVTTTTYSKTQTLDNAIRNFVDYESYVVKNLETQPSEGYYFVGYSSIAIDSRLSQVAVYRVTSTGSYGNLSGHQSMSTPLAVGTELLIVEVTGL